MMGFDQPDYYDADEDELRRRYALGGGGNVPSPAEAVRPPTDLPMIQSAMPSPPSHSSQDQAKLQQMEAQGAGVSHHGGFLRALDAIGSALAPGVLQSIPGTTLQHEAQEGKLRKHITEETGDEEKQAQAQESQAHAYSMLHPQKAPAASRNENQLDLAHLYAQALENNDQAGAERYRQGIVALEQPKLDAGAAHEAASERHQQAQEGLTRRGQDMNDARARDLNKIARDTKAQEKAKPTADEQRRADLAGNLKENLDALEDILNRRPELFGPMGGRFTGLKQTIGTSDPDVAALDTIKHQMGMAQISAHGMRSAHGIEGAATSIVNGFHNTPEAMKGAINAARNSVGTFEQDVENARAGTPTPRTGQAGKGPTPGAVEQGYRFKGGNPADPNSWEKVQ